MENRDLKNLEERLSKLRHRHLRLLNRIASSNLKQKISTENPLTIVNKELKKYFNEDIPRTIKGVVSALYSKINGSIENTRFSGANLGLVIENGDVEANYDLINLDKFMTGAKITNSDVANKVEIRNSDVAKRAEISNNSDVAYEAKINDSNLANEAEISDSRVAYKTEINHSNLANEAEISDSRVAYEAKIYGASNVANGAKISDSYVANRAEIHRSHVANRAEIHRSHVANRAEIKCSRVAYHTQVCGVRIAYGAEISDDSSVAEKTYKGIKFPSPI